MLGKSMRRSSTIVASLFAALVLCCVGCGGGKHEPAKAPEGNPWADYKGTYAKGEDHAAAEPVTPKAGEDLGVQTGGRDQQPEGGVAIVLDLVDEVTKLLSSPSGCAFAVVHVRLRFLSYPQLATAFLTSQPRWWDVRDVCRTNETSRG